jgi:hypothetical protein
VLGLPGKENAMLKKILVPERVRRIKADFACIEHRFLRDGFLASLTHFELLLYLLLVLAADRHGLSFYGFDTICSILKMEVDDYIEARNALIEKDLISFDGRLFQVLSLPDLPQAPVLLKDPRDMERADPATIRQIFRKTFGEKP